MSGDTEKIKLNEESLHIANIIYRLFKSGHIKIGVNLEAKYAEKGSGQWTITQSYAVIGGEHIKLEEGSVEIIEGI